MTYFKYPLTIVVLVLILTGCCKPDIAIQQSSEFIAKQQIDKTQPNWKTQLSQPELLTFSADKHYYWELKTNQGVILIELFPDVAPMHVSSTIFLTRVGFYDGLTFHRVIPGFMAQGGDPLGSGAGNPGYKYAGEFSSDVGHDKAGILSMANAGPNTDGSQFFITFKQTPHLNNRHTVFGQVVKGLEDTLPAIEKLGQRNGRTTDEVSIISTLIIVKAKPFE